MNSANFPSAKYCPLLGEELEVEGESEEGLVEWGFMHDHMAKIPFSYLPSPDNKLMLIDWLLQKDATLEGH